MKILLLSFLILVNIDSIYTKCDINCFNCTNDICEACNYRFGLINGVCYQLESNNCNIDNCSLCFANSKTTCFECYENSKKDVFGKCIQNCFDKNCLIQT